MTKYLLSIVFITNSLYMMPVQAEPYGPGREKARIRAKESSLELDKKFLAVRVLMENTLMTGDKEHDGDSVHYFELAYSKWKDFRSAKCESETHLEVYPIDSRLFSQTVSVCIWRMNKKYIEYLDNVSNTVVSYKK